MKNSFIIWYAIFFLFLSACSTKKEDQPTQQQPLKKSPYLPWRYQLSKKQHSFNWVNSTHFPKGFTMPKGSIYFTDDSWDSFTGIHWSKKIYLFKIGDMEVRRIIIGQKMYDLYDKPDNKHGSGLLTKNLVSVTWSKNRLKIQYSTKKKRASYRYYVYYQNKEYLAEIYSTNKKIFSLNYNKLKNIKEKDVHYNLWRKK